MKLRPNIFEPLVVAIFFLTLFGCGLKPHTTPLYMGNDSVKLSQPENLTVIDARIDKRIETQGISPGGIFFDPDPTLKELLEQAVIKKIPFNIYRGAHIKIRIIDVNSYYRAFLTNAAAKLSITVQADYYSSGKTYTKNYIGGKVEDNFYAGFIAKPSEKIKEYITIAIEQIVQQIENDLNLLFKQ